MANQIDLAIMLFKGFHHGAHGHSLVQITENMKTLIFINPNQYVVVEETEVRDNETCWIYNLKTKILIKQTGKSMLVANDRKVIYSNYLADIPKLSTTPEEIRSMWQKKEIILMLWTIAPPIIPNKAPVNNEI